MKLLLPLLAALACLTAAPACAQGLSSHYDAAVHAEPDTQALAFIRIPFGEQAKERQQPRIGFGLFTDCKRMSNQFSSAHREACDAEPIRSFEFSRNLYDRDWLLSFSGTKRWVAIARYIPGLGFARDSISGPVLQGPTN